MNPKRILSTKKLQPNHRQFLLNANIAVIEADFITVRSHKFASNQINDNLIFTSQNAVKSLLENNIAGLKDKPCYCVGTKTKELLEKNGFTISASAEYAHQLGKLIIEDQKGKSFTFFSGNLRLDTLPRLLEHSDVDFNELTVYETELSPKKINTEIDGILFFSPSGVDSFLQQNQLTNETCFCIGDTTAKAIPSKNIIIANQPTVENVIVQCINYYK